MFDGVPDETRDVLRFMTAGSVDDGKSTLIGRLLYDSKGLMRDQIAAISKAKHARADVDGIDLALVTDGLESEREQGITIDVAYRYFSTPKRAFVIADAPGHEQYTRNMVTAASTAEVAIILIDASRIVGKGLKPQTRRHAAIAKLMGLDVIVAVNKMDLLDWSQAAFDEIREAFERLARTLDFTPVAYVPISARGGDNVARQGGAPWYAGPSLLTILETIPPRTADARAPFRFPIQRVARWGEIDPAARRGYQGRVESGAVRVGDEVWAAPSLLPARVREIRTFDGALQDAVAGQSIAIVLDRDLDLARGDTLASADVEVARAFTADLCWLDTQGWQKGRRYFLRQGARTANAVIDEILFVREVTELAAVSGAATLALNDIASVRLRAQTPLVADTFDALPATGAFVLIDPVTHQTAAAGMIRAAHDIHPRTPVADESYEI
ncbi:MAG: GTP-binding protein [Hyphomonadaceae bacterium]|nr:GTP-binding protein [Hyphomonadaceae bacterium]